MHITKERLKKLIKEEFGRMSEIETGEGKMGSRKPGGESIPGMPHTAVVGAKSGPPDAAAAGNVDVADTLKQVKQTLIAGGAAEDQYLSVLLKVVSDLVVGTNIATDTIAMRALNLLKDRAAKLG